MSSLNANVKSSELSDVLSGFSRKHCHTILSILVCFECVFVHAFVHAIALISCIMSVI